MQRPQIIEDKTMTLGHKIPRPNAFHHSVLVKMAALVAVTAAILAAVVLVIGFRLSDEVERAAFATRARETSGLMTDQIRDALKLAKPELVAKTLDAFDRQIGTGLVSVVVTDAEGGVTFESGTTLADRPDLEVLGALASGSGKIELSGDGSRVAVPVFNDDGQAIIGVLTTQWAIDAATAEARSGKLKVLAYTILTFLLLVAATFWQVRRLLSRPLNELTDRLHALGSGDCATPVTDLGRRDEIGGMYRAAEALRATMADAQKEWRDAAYKGAAFASTSAPLMMIDENYTIVQTNEALVRLIDENLGDFRQVNAGIDPRALIGSSMDLFHGTASRARAVISDPANLPLQTDIVLGDRRMSLKVSAVADSNGTLLGRVVEWEDVTRACTNSAIMASINQNQAIAEFGKDGKLVSANRNFASAIGWGDEELSGMPLERLLVDLDGTSPADLQAALMNGQARHGAMRLSGAAKTVVLDGALCPAIDDRGRTFALILMGTDVTAARAGIEAAELQRAEVERTQSHVVDTLRVALRKLSDGDLTAPITAEVTPQYQGLKEDFNRAQDRLREAIQGVIENATLIRGEASEISSSADDLSRRTEKQAATLEQTAAALDQLTASVKSAAEGAARASQMIGDAKSKAESGGDVVMRAVQAMSAIESSSTRIAKITSVIDGIAFQTNLLALNAGVEAARAGAAGRGFAVVASEVRALAQRSSDAAREISDLISDSGNHVKMGVKLVADTGDALRAIVTSVTEISVQVSDIARSARQQSSGLAEINDAVNQLDQVTQQNAAMFEQTTAASHALTSEAEALSRSMGLFKSDAAGRYAMTVTGPAPRHPDHAGMSRGAGPREKPLLLTSPINRPARPALATALKPMTQVAAIPDAWLDF